MLNQHGGTTSARMDLIASTSSILAIRLSTRLSRWFQPASSSQHWRCHSQTVKYGFIPAGRMVGGAVAAHGQQWILRRLMTSRKLIQAVIYRSTGQLLD